jgi:hypothetical protein
LQDFLTVARGGVTPTLGDLSDPSYILGRPLNLKDREGEAKALAKAILEMKNATLQNAAAERNTANFRHGGKAVARKVAGTLPESKPLTPEQQQALDTG